MDSYGRSYDEFPIELVLAMNVVYLCGEIAGVDLGGGFRGWMASAMVDRGAQVNAVMDVYAAVELLGADPEREVLRSQVRAFPGS